MPRKLQVLAFIAIGFSILVILILGTSPLGSFLTNTLQICSCGLAAALCFLAGRRGRGLSRPFWILVGCSMATWGVANLGWMYYESWLHTVPPRFSLVRMLFDVQGVFYAIALFLDKEKDSPEINLETLLDSVQVAIVFFSLFFGLFYVQLLQGTHPQANELVLTWIFVGTNLGLTIIAAIQAALAPRKRIRTLYGGLAIFLLVYTIGSGIAESPQANLVAQTGSWYDLGWSFPFLVGAIWAARWKETEELEVPATTPRKKLSRLAAKNVGLALPPLLVLCLVVQLGSEWRITGFVLMSLSILCYAVRLGLSEFGQVRAAEISKRNTIAMNSATNGMAILDAEAKYIYVNPAYARMVGSPSAEAMLGKSWDEISNPQDIAHVRDEIRATLQQQGKWFGPITVHHRDGTAVPTEVAITLLPGGGTICVTRDLSQQLSAQRARAEAEIRYRMLIEQVAAISYIAEIGVHGKWLYVSPQIESILGYSEEEWLSESTEWMRHVLPEDWHVIEKAEEASSRGEQFQAEYRITRKDGRVVWVSDSAVVVRGSDSHPVMEGLIVDITERKQLENQLQQSRRMEAVGRLAGGIAHDFNNLLTIIKGYAEMALNRPGKPAELTADVQQIGNAAERASTLIRQLLAFSRKQVLQPKLLDLNASVEGLDKLLSRLMGSHIQMTTVYGKNIGTVKADPSQIEQVIMNLVVNARDAMPNGGRLTIETSNVELDANYALDHVSVKPGPYVMLAVSDSGVGIEPETLAHIFEPFYTTKSGGRGTGLGLSTVYGIVKQSGGYIWVYSEPGKGATFKVYLPRVEESVAPSRAVVEHVADRGGTETVLLVEDEEAVRELTRTILAQEGYSVLVAKNAEHAEQLAATGSNEIHLLLTDVVMPGVSGRDLARRITARNPRTRVLFMSGYTDSVIAHGGVLESGVAFLQKPFTPRSLKQKVREVLDRAVPIAST